MKPAFLIFVVAALLVGSSSAEAARGTAAGNKQPDTPGHAADQLSPTPTSNESDRRQLHWAELWRGRYQSDRWRVHGPGLWRFTRQSGIAHLRSQCRIAIARQ